MTSEFKFKVPESPADLYDLIRSSKPEELKEAFLERANYMRKHQLSVYAWQTINSGQDIDSSLLPKLKNLNILQTELSFLYVCLRDDRIFNKLEELYEFIVPEKDRDDEDFARFHGQLRSGTIGTPRFGEPIYVYSEASIGYRSYINNLSLLIHLMEVGPQRYTKSNMLDMALNIKTELLKEEVNEKVIRETKKARGDNGSIDAQ